MRRHAKAPSAGSTSSRASRKLLGLAILALLASLALGVSLAGAIAPSVTIENAENVDYTSAKVKGTVDPGDHFTEYHFEAATEADFSNVNAFAGFGSLAENAGTQPVEGEFTGLKPGTAYHLRLVASNNLDGQVEAVAASTFTTKAVAAPTVSIDPVTAVTADSAHFEGKINPNAPVDNPAAADVKWRFDCTPDCPGIEGEQTIEADSSTHDVEANASGLDPNTDYQVKLVASNAGGSVEAGPESFKTDAVGPEVVSLPVGPVTETTAVIGGWVYPNGSPTTWYVEYATQPDFSDAVSVPATEDASAGSGQSAVAVSALATDLLPDADYRFRLVADSDAGGETSDPQSFHTLASVGPAQSCPNQEFRVGPSAGLPDCRAFEKLTPSDKNGGSATPGAVLDGDHVNILTTTSILPEDPYYKDSGRYLAARPGTGAWALRTAWIAANTQIADVNNTFSQDVINQSCESCPALLSEDTDQAPDVYVRDANGLGLISQGSIGGNSGQPAAYAGQSADGSHILFETKEHLEPADSESRDPLSQQIYERVGNQTRVVGLDSDEQPLNDGGAVLGDGATRFGVPSGSANAISADGSTIFFESPEPRSGLEHQLYARIDGQDTVQVSASKCQPACGPSASATFQGAAEDGSRVYFTSAAKLLPADTDDLPDLYQYRFQGDQLTLVSEACVAADGSSVDCGWSQCLAAESQEPVDCTAPNAVLTFDNGVLGVSDDGRRVYFVSPPVPSDNFGPAHVPSTSIWFYDEVAASTEFVAPGFGGSSKGLQQPSIAARMTSDGGSLVFSSPYRLTSYDNGRFRELHRYRADTDVVDCISCNPAGAPAIGEVDLELDLFQSSAALSPIAGAQHPNQLISDDGRVILFHTGDALVADDVNGRQDVYAWNQGKLSLITSGSATADSQIMGVTADGRDIFFTTSDRLVPTDVDSWEDLYDARIGGGLSSDHPAPGSTCSGEACRGGLSASPGNLDPGSNSFAGPGNPKQGKARCHKGKVRHKGRCVVKKQRRSKKHRASNDRRDNR